MIKYLNEFRNWITISWNQRRCSLSLWSLYNYIFLNRNVLTFEIIFIIINNSLYKDVAFITITEKIEFRNAVFLIYNSINFWFIFRRRFFVLIFAMSCCIWLFDIKDNIWLFCVDSVIRIKNFDFKTFELSSNFYEIWIVFDIITIMNPFFLKERDIKIVKR